MFEMRWWAKPTLLQPLPQRPLAVMNPRPHGAKLAADDAGNLLVAHLLQEPQHEHFPLLRRKYIERRVNPCRVVRRKIAFFRGCRVDHARLVELLLGSAALS